MTPSSSDFDDDSAIATVFGVVPDGTKSVTVGQSKAILGENVFMARNIDQSRPVEMRITTDEGTRSTVLLARLQHPGSPTT